MQCVEQKTSSAGVKVFQALDRDTVISQVRTWAQQIRQTSPQVMRIGLFGSYARGDYAPGSDIDLLVLVDRSSEPKWFARSSQFDVSCLAVPADLFVYTEAEAQRMRTTNPWFKHVWREVVWVHG